MLATSDSAVKREVLCTGDLGAQFGLTEGGEIGHPIPRAKKVLGHGRGVTPLEEVGRSVSKMLEVKL